MESSQQNNIENVKEHFARIGSFGASSLSARYSRGKIHDRKYPTICQHFTILYYKEDCFMSCFKYYSLTLKVLSQQKCRILVFMIEDELLLLIFFISKIFSQKFKTATVLKKLTHTFCENTFCSTITILVILGHNITLISNTTNGVELFKILIEHVLI